MFVIFSAALNDNNFTVTEKFCLFRFFAMFYLGCYVDTHARWYPKLGSKEVEILAIDVKNQAKYQYKSRNGKTDIFKNCRWKTARIQHRTDSV